MRRKRIEDRLRRNRERRDLYLKREAEILEGQAISYTIGSRSLTRSSTSLDDLRDAIKRLDDEIAEDEALLCGCRSRYAGAVVPRDW